MTELPPGASPVDSIAPGTRLREWEVVRFLGRGSYGVVFEAQRSSWLDEAPRALKVFDPIISSAARSELLGEFSALTGMHHPHLLTGFDAFDLVEPPFTGCVAFVLELAEEDLANRVAVNGPRPVAEVAAIGTQIASGLAALHAEARIHGDVKPENILRIGDRWTLGDFGVTSVLDGSYAVTAGTTIDYRPPEAARAGEGSRLHRSADIWALGVALHVAATGRHPFPGPDPMMRYAAVVRGDRARVEGFDDDLLALIDSSCLVADPHARLDAADLVERLQKATGGLSTGAPLPPPPPPVPVRPAPGTASVPETAADPGAEQIGRSLATIAAVVAATLVITQVVAVAAGALLDGLTARRAVYVGISIPVVGAGLGVLLKRVRLRPAWMAGAVAGAVVMWLGATAVLFGMLA